LQQRITELEERAAFQEQTIEELNQALVSQELALQKLERVCSELVRRMDAMRSTSEAAGNLPSAKDELPPHY